MNDNAKHNIPGKDDDIKTTGSSNENDNISTFETTEDPHEFKITNPWNWRLETDTAALFLAML